VGTKKKSYTTCTIDHELYDDDKMESVDPLYVLDEWDALHSETEPWKYLLKAMQGCGGASIQLTSSTSPPTTILVWAKKYMCVITCHNISMHNSPKLVVDRYPFGLAET